MRRLRTDERGATLVELLVVMVVGALVVAAVSHTVVGAMRAQRRQVARVEALNSATLALERLGRDLRGAEVADAISASHIEFRTWRAGTARQVSVSVEPDGDGTHRLTVRDPASRVLLRSVADAAVFGYQDADGLALAPPVAPERIAAITLTLTLALPEGRGDVVLTDHVTLRNAER